jgi:hypothetical protein
VDADARLETLFPTFPFSIEEFWWWNLSVCLATAGLYTYVNWNGVDILCPGPDRATGTQLRTPCRNVRRAEG